MQRHTAAVEQRGLPDRPRRQTASEQTAVECRILDAVRGLEFGSVEIVVHDSQVVQIERREKQRLDKPAQPDSQARPARPTAPDTDAPRRAAPSRPQGQSGPGAR
jgi:hypothetical protein